jgi:hypothetical protein
MKYGRLACGFGEEVPEPVHACDVDHRFPLDVPAGSAAARGHPQRQDQMSACAADPNKEPPAESPVGFPKTPPRPWRRRRRRQKRALRERIAEALGQRSPASWPSKAICVRLSKSSLLRMLLTWALSVATPMNKAAASPSTWDGCHTQRPAAARLLDGAQDQPRHGLRLRHHGRVQGRHLLDPLVPRSAINRCPTAGWLGPQCPIGTTTGWTATPAGPRAWPPRRRSTVAGCVITGG